MYQWFARLCVANGCNKNWLVFVTGISTIPQGQCQKSVHVFLTKSEVDQNRTPNKPPSSRVIEDGRKLALLTQAYFRSVEEFRANSAKDEAVRIGAGESVFRWLIMPRLAELQNLAGSVQLEFLTKTTMQSVESVKAEHLDLGIVRKEAADDSLSVLPCGSLAYALVVPRKLLPGRTAAGLSPNYRRSDLPVSRWRNCSR